MKISTYIMQLKDATGYSWNQISERSKVPVSTIRSIANGSVEQPSYQTLQSIVEAIGGSMDDLYAAPRSVRSEMLEVRKAEAEGTDELKLTIRTMRDIREQMLAAQKESYERQLQHMKEAHERETKSLRDSNRMLRITAVLAISALLIIMVTIIGILIYDLTHLDRGWVQAFFDHAAGTWKSVTDAVCSARWFR